MIEVFDIRSMKSGDRLMMVAESMSEAVEVGAKYYIGGPCHRKCQHYTPDKAKVNGAVRYVKCRSCVKCAAETQKERTRKRLSDDNGDVSRVEARKRLEDIALAKELGISVDDL